jgi:hypothetical protein
MAEAEVKGNPEAAASPATPATPADANADENWREALDRSTGRKYFYNRKTKQTTWVVSAVGAGASGAERS